MTGSAHALGGPAFSTLVGLLTLAATAGLSTAQPVEPSPPATAPSALLRPLVSARLAQSMAVADLNRDGLVDMRSRLPPRHRRG